MEQDTKIFIPRIQRRDYKHAGLDMIVLGFFGLFAYGIGLLILVRGILILIYSLSELNTRPGVKQFLAQHPQNGSFYIVREIFQAVMPYFGSLAIYTYIASVGALFTGQTEVSPVIALGIIGFICLMFYLNKVLPLLNATRIEQTDMKIAIRSIVFGVVAMATAGSGSVPLFTGILLIILIQMYSNNPGIVLNNAHPGELLEMPVGERSSPSAPESMPISSTPISSIRVERDQEGKAVPKFDPETGQPLVMESASKKPLPQELPEMQRLFTVLLPEVRQQLMALPISEVERKEIAEHLVYLARDSQLKYLEEIAVVNAAPNVEELDYRTRIQKLNLPEDQKKFLLQQLDFLPPNQQKEFVMYLENTSHP